MKYLIIILIFLNFGFIQAQGSLEQLQQKHDQQLAQSKARFEKNKTTFENGMNRLSMFRDPSNKAKEKARLEKNFKQAQGSQANLKIAQNKEMAEARKKASPQERKAFDQARINRIKNNVAAETRTKDKLTSSTTTNAQVARVQYEKLPSDAQRNNVQYTKLPTNNGQAAVSPTSVNQANRLLSTSPVNTGRINGAQQSQQARDQAVRQNQSFGALVNNKNATKAEKLRADRARLDQSYQKQRADLSNELVQKKSRLTQNATVVQRANQNIARTPKALKAANTPVSTTTKKANAKLDAQIKKKSDATNKSYIKKKKSLDKKIKKADKKVQKDIKKGDRKKKSVKAKRKKR